MANPKNANFVCVDPTLGVPIPASATGTVRLFPPGYIARFEDKQTGASSGYKGGAGFVYMQGSNVTVAGQMVMLSNNSAVLLAVANSASFFPIGVAAGNISATNVWGWVQVQGICDYLLGTNSSIAAGAALYVAAGTSGLAVSNAVAGNKINGIVPIQSYTSADTNILVQLNYPLIAGLTANL